MPGFSSFDQIIDTQTVQGKGQDYIGNKASITTVASAIHSLWTAAGEPGVGTFGGTPLAARACSNSTTGAIKFTNPTPPDTLHMLTAWLSSTIAAGTFHLMDRLLDYATISFTSTSLQTLDNTVTLPRYTAGAGVRMFFEVTTGLGATPQTVTITYTNQAGTGSRVATLSPVVSSAAARVPQTGFFIPLADGDSGVRSVQSCQLGGSMGAGVGNLTLCRPFFVMPITQANFPFLLNLATSFPLLQQLVDSQCLMLLIKAATTSSGNVDFGLGAAAR
ncbi:hypothetical protein BH20PSE1_BH20PSE1_00920 [soil metagenome]